MYDVVKFIQKQKIRVLAVPTAWIQTDYIMWPEQLPEDAVDRMRVQGAPCNGPARPIPMIMKGRFALFQQAEATAKELAKRHASDEDYAPGELAGADFNNGWRENSVIQPQPASHQQQPTSQQQQPSTQQQLPIQIEQQGTDRPHWAPMTVIGPSTIQQQPEPVGFLDADRYCANGPTVKVENFEEYLSGNSAVLTYAAFKSEMDSFKNELNTFIQKTVETCFHSNFARFTPLLEQRNKADQNDKPGDTLPLGTPYTATTPVEKRRPIRNEEELDEWNAELADEELCRQYLQYFSKIIQPNKHAGKGDNACYIIVDCLFTREFWNQFTWTGINRGMKKSSRGFREFGNVTRLLLNIVRLGDPSYNAERLENFCKTRLFRYSRARSVSQKLRKSACRPARALKSLKKAQNAALIMDVDFEVTKTEIGLDNTTDNDGSGLDL